MYRNLHRNLLGGAAAIAIAAASTTFAIQPADAGGLTPAPAAHADWTGFTIGGHIGGAQSEWSGFWATSTQSTLPTNFNGFDDSGLTGGMHIGYNLMVPGAVYGLDVVVGGEADWSAVGMAGQDTFGRNRCGNGSLYDCNASIEYTASLRGRLGLALGQIHTYATLGAGWVDANAFIGSSSSGQNFSFKDTSWVWGFGFEYLLAHNLVVGAEYLRYEVDDRKEIFFNNSTTDTRDQFMRLDDLSVIRAKASYKFGG